jgi:hypothetical protein
VLVCQHLAHLSQNALILITVLLRD